MRNYITHPVPNELQQSMHGAPQCQHPGRLTRHLKFRPYAV
jgi:hypothetical protein